MPAKSIVQIQVDDEQFKKFKSSYDAYLESLKKLPGAWGAHDKAVKQTGVSITELLAALFAQSELTKKTATEQEKVEKSAKRTGRIWKDMARDTKKVATDITHATVQLVKWAGLTSVFAGLAGAGGLFGIERMALSASNYRRQGFGVNATPAELRAFQTDYSKYLADPADLLSNINRVASTPSEQWGFGGQVAALAGQGRDSAQIAAALLPSMVEQFVKLGGLGRMGQSIYSAYGFDRFASFQDFQTMGRLRNELGESGRRYAGDVSAFATPDETSRRWQDFMIQLDRAGNKIETIFVNDLAPLEPGLEKLSDAVVHIVDSFMRNPNFPKWLDEASDGMERLAKWLGGIDFGGSSGSSGSPSPADQPIGRDNHPDYSKGDWFDRNVNAHLWGTGATGSFRGGNNSVGLRMPGSKNFRTFNNYEDSIRAGYRQLQRDIQIHGLTNLHDIISDEKWGWAPGSDGNNDSAYLASLRRDTGIFDYAPISATDTDKLAAILAGISKVENPKHAFTKEQVIKVINQTGGSAIIQSNQVAQ